MTDVERVIDLQNSLEVAIGIECTRCGNTEDSTARSEYWAAVEFDKDGWRVLDNETCCPDCAKNT